MNTQHEWLSKNILSKKSHALKRVDTLGFQLDDILKKAKQFYDCGTKIVVAHWGAEIVDQNKGTFSGSDLELFYM